MRYRVSASLLCLMLVAFLGVSCSREAAQSNDTSQDRAGQTEPSAVGQAEASIEGSRVALIIAFDGFKHVEFSTTRDVLREAGALCEVFSSEKGDATSMDGRKFSVSQTLSDLDVKKFDAVVFIGGAGARSLWDDETAHNIARKAYSEGKVVAAICFGPVVLARSGLLADREATSFPSERSSLVDAGCEYSDQDVVTDGRIVTANGPDATQAFARALVAAIVKNTQPDDDLPE